MIRMTRVFILKLKSDDFVILKNFIQLVQIQFQKTIKVVRTDKGTELNRNCHNLFSTHGIVHIRTCAYTPQQNKVLERKHRYIFEIAREIKFYVPYLLSFRDTVY